MRASQIYYLSKDELIYEAHLRGIKLVPNYDSNQIRKLISQSLKDKILPQVENLKGVISVSSELSMCCKKVQIFDNLLEDLNNDIQPVNANKLEAKVSHLKNRIQNLKRFKMEQEDESKVKDLLTKVITQEKVFSEIFNKISPEELKLADDLLNESFKQDFPSQKSSDSVQGDNINNLPMTVTQDTSSTQRTVSHTTDQGDNTQEECIMSNSGPVINPNSFQYNSSNNFTSVFNKIPNPAECVIREIPTTDGLNAMELLNFLKSMLKLKSQCNLNDVEILAILLNFGKGPLLSKITECKEHNLSLENVHTILLETFIPATLRSKLHQDLVLRPQKNNEPLSVYIYEVKSYSKLLLSSFTEFQLVEFIKYGINFECRNTLTFQKNPVSFADLEQLCIASQNVIYSDATRNNMSDSNPNVNGNQHVSGFNQPNRGRYVSNIKTCFNCHKKGHISRNCYYQGNKNGNFSKNW